MLERLHKYNTEKSLFRKEDKVLVAVSGGVDSVVLVHLLSAIPLSFSIAHCNFGLRGEDSELDQAFVQELAQHYNVPFYLKKFSKADFDDLPGQSIQMAARKLRYDWFQELLYTHQFDLLMTAHHQNDTIETILLNLVRGTGISGLHGILPKQNKTIRPLLFATKEEIQAYAMDLNLSWREDKSNASSYYQRNLLRLEVIPQLKKMNPNFDSTFVQSIEKIKAVEHIFTEYIEQKKKEYFSPHENYLSIDLTLVEKESEPIIVLFEFIKEYGFNYSQTVAIFEARNQEAGKQFFSSTHTLVKDRKKLILTEIHAKEILPESILLDEKQANLFIPWLNKSLRIEQATGEIEKDTEQAFLHASKLVFPLKIRKWLPGDEFQPLGMKGYKKVSDFLTDLKIPLNLKEKVTVLLSGNEIVWVVGLRISDAYKAIPNQPTLNIRLI